jgi:hypothetical protein
MNRVGLPVLLATALAVTAACGGAGSGPRATLELYSQSLRTQNWSQAYAMMSSSFQAKHSKEDFARMMRENEREAAETATRLAVSPDAVEVTAEFGYGLGDTMRLTQEGGEWRIASNPVAFYDQSTPRAALRSFLRAYRLERWDVMLRFVPNKYREKMDVAKVREQFAGAHQQEVAIRMNMLEANLEEPIVDKNNEARMPYGERYEVKFVREDGEWKVKDPD